MEGVPGEDRRLAALAEKLRGQWRKRWVVVAVMTDKKKWTAKENSSPYNSIIIS